SSLIDEPKEDMTSHQASLAYLRGHEEYLKGKVASGINSLEESLNLRSGLLSQYNIVESLTGLGFAHMYSTGKTDLALDYFTKSLAASEKLGNSTAIAHSLNRLGVYYWETNNFDKALAYFEKSLALYQELKNPLWIGGLSNNISLVYRRKENYDLALNYLEKALAADEKLGNLGGVGTVLGNIGGLYALKGEPSVAISYLERSLEVREKIGEKLAIAYGLQSLGHAHIYWTGDLGAAHEYINRSLALSRESGGELAEAWGLNYLATIYSLQGELELALEKAQASLMIFSRIGYKSGLVDCQCILGIIYRDMGEYDLAKENLAKSMDLIKKITVGGSTALWTSFLLIHLILVSQSLNDIDLGQKYLNMMKEIQQESKNKYVSLRARLAEGIVLKMSDRAAQKFQAQKVFDEIVNEEVLDINLTVLAMLNLCELLILEMEFSKKAEDILDEVTSLSERFREIAEKQQSSALIVMAQLLQAKLALVQGADFAEVSHLLSSAKVLASEKKLGTLLNQVNAEKEAVQARQDTWNDLILRKATVHERIYQARVVDWLNEAKKIQGTWVRPSTADRMDQ
ncbi:MAG: tetratricopeptide repeat protein, partial [Candidatus Heimdallarchaeota archaeon]